MIETRNYLSGTLRKGRIGALEADLAEVFLLYEAIKPCCMKIKVQDFVNLWEQCHMQYIFQCLSEEEDEGEFAHLLFEVTFKKYFLNRSKIQKVFAIFSLYCEFFACERRRKIAISKIYINELITLMKESPDDANCDYFKVIKYLHQNCFNYTFKIGTKNIILKPVVQSFRKNIIMVQDPIASAQKLKERMKDIGNDIEEYEKKKNEAKSLGIDTKTIQNTDIYFNQRISDLVRDFQKKIIVEADR